MNCYAATSSDDSNFDIPMLFSDHLYDSETGILTFDTFNFDGVLGDRFLVNGKVQPVPHVHPRRYRFRWRDAGPSRLRWHKEPPRRPEQSLSARGRKA